MIDEATATERRPLVMVADDDDVLRQLAQTVLELAGYRVLPAFDGQDAVDLFERHAGEIDAIVLDSNMPRLSGEGALLRIRTIRPGIPAVLISGDEESRRIAGRDLEGHVVFVAKPFTPEELVAGVREARSG